MLALLSVLFCFFQHGTPLLSQDLGGTWNVRNVKMGYNLPAIIPGGIYTDLMRNGVIGDVFYKFNDIETRWVSKMDWNYWTTFDVSLDLLSHKNINIVFDGVDTFSEISINGMVIGHTENMFVRYVFSVKRYVRLGSNNISVEFKSPVETARSLFLKQARNYVVPPVCVPEEYNGECHVNHIRKMQASFAWDWGPAFPSVGIWKPVYLEAYNSTLLRDVTVNIFSNTTTNHWDMQINSYLAANTSISTQGMLKIQLTTEIENITKFYEINVTKSAQGDDPVIHNFSIPQTYVRPWWPNGYDTAKLYTLTVSFLNQNRTEESSRSIKVGFRTVELIQNAVANGRTFYFKVNGVPIFAKGANSIPISILPELGQNESTIRFLLQSAKDVNMNMLRVWGGGVYESDMFYQLADEMGLMIWQDFMFACSMYPTSDDFLRTVREEVKHQIKRLQHHPSIIIWAANNENEAALSENWYNTAKKISIYRADYIKLYVETVKNETLMNDQTRPFVTSSPTNGIESEREGYVAKNPGSYFYGDIHYYNYFLDSWTSYYYPTSRFSSEYGYQSLPTESTIVTATNNSDDLDINSAFLNSRQHHPMGYSQMELLISYQLKLPNDTSKNFINAFIFYSQVIQAMAIKVETEYYRQWRSSLDDAGRGLTMGALYWQLNDVWVAPTWSSIDFKNNWKMLHYYAKKFFAPIIITGNVDIFKQLNIYVVSDLMKPIFNATASIEVFNWKSFTPLYQRNIQIDVLPAFSKKIGTYSLESLSSTDGICKQTIEDCLIYLTLRDNDNKTLAPDNYIFPVPLLTANLEKPSLKISRVTQTDSSGRNFKIEVISNKIALFVWLEARNVRGTFSDNGFLQITQLHIVYFKKETPISATDLQNSLSVTNLLDDQYL